jgi:hypothetical protein
LQGIVGDPDRVIKNGDFLIFLSATSTPLPSTDPLDLADFDAEAKALVAATSASTRGGKRATVTLEDLETKNVLLCGWRR